MPNEYLTTIDEARQRVRRTRSTDEVPTTELVGDPDEGAPEATGQASAAAGAVVGGAVAGPVGMAVGAGVAGAAGAAGAAAETVDDDRPATRDEVRKDEQLEDWEQRR